VAAVFEALLALENLLLLLPTLAYQWFDINDLGELIACCYFIFYKSLPFALATLLVCFVVSIFSRGF